MVWDAMLIAGVSSLVAIGVNLVHPEKIPFVADKEYEILVPCPEPGGEVTPLPANDSALWAGDTFVVDARSKEKFSKWKFGQAMNVPYDYLEPTPKELIQELTKRITSSRSKRVVVYGDGKEPDSGEHLGREISGLGIKNVFFVLGGAPAIRAQAQSGKK